MANDSGGGFWAGFVLGALVGAAAALLFAPGPGEETREQLRERGIELRDRAEVLSEEARRRAETLSDEARRRAQEVIEEGKRAAEEKQAELRSRFEAQKGDSEA